MCYLRDTMPPQWSPFFLVLVMLLVWHYTTQWSSGTALVLFTGYYATPVVTWGSNAGATDLRKRFLISGVFYLALLLAFFKASLGTAGRHTIFKTEPRICLDHNNPQKIFICSRFYLRLRTSRGMLSFKNN